MPTFVRKTDNIAAASGAFRDTVWGGNPATGNSVAVFVFWKGAVTVTNVTDSQGNQYVDCGAGVLTRPTDGFIQIFLGPRIVGGITPTVTVVFSAAATSIDVVLGEWQPDAGFILVPDQVCATGTSTSGTSVTTGAFTPTTASGVVVAWGETDDTNASAGAGMTIRSNPAGSGAGMEDRIYSGAPGSITASMTLSSAVTKAGIIAAVMKQQSSVAPTPNRRIMAPQQRMCA